MSSRFSEYYKKKRGRKCRNICTKNRHCNNNPQYNLKADLKEKNIAITNAKQRKCSKSQQCSSVKIKDNRNEKKIKQLKSKSNRNDIFSSDSFIFCQKDKSLVKKKIKKKNSHKKSCSKDRNNLVKNAEKILIDTNNKIKIKKKETSVKRGKKWKQKINEMASPNGQIFKKDTTINLRDEHTNHCGKPKHVHQNNHRRCSTRITDCQMKDNNSKEASMPELPGMYYDRERKAYFKILPNHSCIGNAVTTATIRFKEKEEVRKNDLTSKSKLHSESIRKRQSSGLSTLHLPCLTCQFQRGEILPRELDFNMNMLRIRNINKIPQAKIKIYTDSRRNWLERLEHAAQLEMIENKRIVGLFSIKESMIQRILWLKLKDKPVSNQRDRLSLFIDPSPSCHYYQSAVKISSMRLINRDCVLYTGMVYTGTPESLVFIKGLGEGANRYEVYSLGQKATWTCAWNKHANQFSVGSEKCGMLLDVETRRLWEINSNNSDVLCQVFSTQDGHYLYSGTRKNQIFTHDLRSISTYSVSQLSHSSSVCGMSLLQNDTHLVSSDVKGKVNLWDLRTRKVVTEYHGFKNEYLRIPIHVDESEQVVYGVDQDGYTRLWCLQTGELLKTVPPPMATSYDFFPSVLYSKNWNDRLGNAGLLLGLGDKIYVYSDFQED